MTTAVEAPETEQELVSTAQRAISSCNWTVGECAAQWTKRYAKGRTDADFGSMVGLSGDQVYQRRRVWETFDDVRGTYGQLKWSHYYVALTWNDSPECLAWAEENQATVAEMKAWRRMQHGEDLTVEAEADLDRDYSNPGYGDPILQIVPEHFGENDGTHPTSDSLEESQASGNRIDAVTGDTEGPGAGYAPFRKDAGSKPREEGSGDSQPVGLNPEQAIKRVTSALERSARMLTESTLDGFGDLSEKMQLRFKTAVENLNEKITGIT